MNNINFLVIPLLLLSFNSLAEQSKEQWQDTVLSEETINKIQQSGYDYKKCVSDEMQKPVHQDKDSRLATDEIIKQCESHLTKMREVYLNEKVPEIIADRHLKQMRIKTTRNVLQEMMYLQAARSSNPK